MKKMAQRVTRYGTTVFTEMTNLAAAHGAINLGQGFPNFAAPEFVVQAAQQALAQGINQYPPPVGRLRLRRAIAAKMQRHYGLHYDPDSEILAMHGATECLFATTQALIDPGDEVIIFEPFYDSYVPDVEMAGGVPRYYALQPPDWSIDFEQLERLVNDKTTMIIVNTPHNPTGKVYSRDELAQIATICQRHDLLALADEVYEHILFDGCRHVPLASLPGMAERTITVSSIGKSFSVTGWKVGWIAAAAPLCNAIFRSHQWITFAGAAPLEEASAVALEEAEHNGYYEWLQQMYQDKRDRLIDALTAAGLPVITPQGTYFVMVDISALGFKDDREFCYYLTKEIGVAAIPPSAFYQTAGGGQTIARFAFCKTDDALQQAAERLLRLRDS